MNMNRIFKDEEGRVVTMRDLLKDYESGISEAESFADYVWNCQDHQGGTLEELPTVEIKGNECNGYTVTVGSKYIRCGSTAWASRSLENAERIKAEAVRLLAMGIDAETIVDYMVESM